MKQQEGLIPKMLKRWAWRRKFTKEEREELDKIKKDAFMTEMRKKAEVDGKQMAAEEA
jgi:hypothetical protein